MTDVRAALLRFVWLFEQEEGVSCEIILQQLEERFGDEVIPGLIDCLTDSNADVRLLSVRLLGEARPRSNVAVPALIERLNDVDHRVRAAVVEQIADFGPIAAAAIPQIEMWLDLVDNDYLRIMALTAIVSLDRDRTELLAEIKDALQSDNPVVRFVVLEFLAKMKIPLPFDETAFQEAVLNHWKYHVRCEQVHWSFESPEDGAWEIDLAPVFQELYGGENDGKKIWAGFEVDLHGLAEETGMEVEDSVLISRCEHRFETPFVGVKGEYFGEPFVLRIFLEPLPETEIREVRDVLKNEVRSIDEEDGSDWPPF